MLHASLLAALAAALLAGCGGGEEKPDPTEDTTAPTVAISDDVSAATASGNVTFTFTFSEDVGTSFTAADVTLAGGAKGDFAKVSATVYTLVAVPAASAAGTLEVSVPAGAFADLAGNASGSPASTSQAYDTRVVNPDKTRIALPVTFDADTVDYALLGFEGAEDSSVQPDPTNAANKVARVVRSSTAQPWAGTTLTAADGEGFGNRIPFDASNTRMTVRVWSPDAGIKVRLKAESKASSTVSVETEATTTVASAWETLTFDFGKAVAGGSTLVPTGNYEKLTIFFNFGVGGATAGAKTYYFDDVVFIGGGGLVDPGPTSFATVTFDVQAVTYALVGFGGADDSAVIADPNDAANKVGRVNRSATAEIWAGTTIVTGPNNTVGKLGFDASNTRMTVRVWSPTAGITVRLKAEDHTDGTVTVEADATTTVASAWETLTFDFAKQATGTAALNVTKTYDRLSIFFNFGVAGSAAGARTYYFDDVTFIGGGGITPPPVDTTPPTLGISDNALGTASGDVTFTFTFSEDVGTSFVADDVTLTGGTKGAFTRVSATEYTLVAVPPADATGTLEVSVAAGAFTDVAGNASVAAASASQAYDTRGAPPAKTQMDLPVTFDVATVDYGLVGFGGADDSTIVPDPTNATNNVARVNRSATAEVWAGTTVTAAAGLGFASRIPFDAQNTRLTVNVWSPDAGITVRMKVENRTNSAVFVEKDATTTVAAGWETLTFDFGAAGLVPTADYEKLSLFFNFGVGGATAGAKTYYFDDVTFIGGGGVPTATEFPPLDFDTSGVTYTFAGFGGAEDASVIVDPGSATNHVAQVVKSAGAESWAGTTIATGENNSVAVIPFTATRTKMSVRVYSPHAGIQVRLKVENAGNNTQTCETEATVTTADGWQTLEFDFASPASGTAAYNPSYTFNKISIFFNFGVTGATAGARTYLFDDVTFLP